MAKSGWHQTTLDKAHELAGAIKADQAAALQGAEEHLKSVAVPQVEASESGG
jgi:hypothetical protein